MSLESIDTGFMESVTVIERLADLFEASQSSEPSVRWQQLTKSLGVEYFGVGKGGLTNAEMIDACLKIQSHEFMNRLSKEVRIRVIRDAMNAVDYLRSLNSI